MTQASNQDTTSNGTPPVDNLNPTPRETIEDIGKPADNLNPTLEDNIKSLIAAWEALRSQLFQKPEEKKRDNGWAWGVVGATASMCVALQTGIVQFTPPQPDHVKGIPTLMHMTTCGVLLHGTTHVATFSVAAMNGQKKTLAITLTSLPNNSHPESLAVIGLQSPTLENPIIESAKPSGFFATTLGVQIVQQATTQISTGTPADEISFNIKEYQFICNPNKNNQR